MGKREEKPQLAPDREGKFPLGSVNSTMLAIGFGVIILGFILMAGGGSDDPKVFNPAIFGFRRITLAPIVVLLGFLFEIVAIMYRGKKR